MILHRAVLTGHKLDQFRRGFPFPAFQAAGHDQVAAPRRHLVLGVFGYKCRADLIAVVRGQLHIVGKTGRGGDPHGGLLIYHVCGQHVPRCGSGSAIVFEIAVPDPLFQIFRQFNSLRRVEGRLGPVPVYRVASVAADQRLIMPYIRDKSITGGAGRLQLL